MGRPRKDRIGEHAGQLATELRRLLGADVLQAVAELRAAQQRELTVLRRAIAALERRVDTLVERDTARRSKVGRWVPGGPGRPPKDAQARIAAFNQRQKTKAQRKPRPKTKPTR